jgi:hypothetical protein
MKKAFLFIALLILFTTVNAQYLGSDQLMHFAKQSDLPNYVRQKNGQLAFCNDVKTTFQYDSASVAWMPLARVVIKKSTVVVNGKATGLTKIYTTEASTLKFYPTGVVIRATNISGVTTQPTASVGTNSTAYNNIVTGSLLNTLLNTLSVGSGSPQPASISTPIPGNTDIYVNVTIAAIATNYSYTVEIIGFYDN